MPSNLRSFDFKPVGTGASNLRIRTTNTVKLAYGKWYKLEFDLKSSESANRMTLKFSTGTTYPSVLVANHRWALGPTGTPTLTYWGLVGLSTNPGGYGCYQQWGAQTRYVKSNTDAEVYLHFEVLMKTGTEAYAVKLDNFSLTRVATAWTDVAAPTDDWTDVDPVTTDFTDVDPVTTDWSDA